MFLRAFVLIIILFQTGLSAQQARNSVFSLLPAVGMNACQIHGDSYSGYNKFGFLAGVAVNARVGEKTSLQLGFYFSQKGARHNPNFKTGDYSYYRLNLNYIDLPLSLRYFANDKYFITLGPSIAYLFSYSENINYTNMTGVYRFNKYEVGLNFGLGRKISEKFLIEVRCSNSITSIRDYGITSKIFYPNPVARFFNKGFYSNILSLIVSYNFDFGESGK
jgi:hypothetical protein